MRSVFTSLGDVSGKRRAKAGLEQRLINGIFLGLTDRGDKAIVHGAEGVRKARIIR